MVPAKWYYAGRRSPIRLVVVHCTVSPDSRTGAEAVANYFARGERRASAHRVCDSDSTVICVNDEDTAFGAAGANSDGLHLELIGLPDQTTAQWLDAFSDAMLREAGATIREWSREYGIPMRWLTIAEVADGRTKGLCTHADVSKAFPAVSTGHWDPGPNFPKQEALRLWSQQKGDDDMTPEQAAALARIDRVIGNLDPSVASIRSVTDALYTATVQGRLGGLAALIRQIVREELANQSGSQ